MLVDNLESNQGGDRYPTESNSHFHQLTTEAIPFQPKKLLKWWDSLCNTNYFCSVTSFFKDEEDGGRDPEPTNLYGVVLHTGNPKF